MKTVKFLVLALSLMAINASALSFVWTAASIKFDGASLKSDSGVTGYLVYLGSGASLSESYDISSDTVDTILSNIGEAVDSKNKTSTASKLSQAYSFDYGTKVNGDAFALLLTYASGSDVYYNLSSTVYTLSGITAENSSPEAATFSFSYDTAAASDTITAGSGWTKATAVPEPATGALALAGLAMLFRRRKA